MPYQDNLEIKGLANLEGFKKDMEETMGFTAPPAPKDLLLKDIDKYCKGKLKTSPYGSYTIKPSHIGSCVRSVYFTLTHAPGKRKVDGQGYRIMELGNLVHEWLQLEVFEGMNDVGILKTLRGKDLPFATQDGVDIDFAKDYEKYNIPKTEIKFKDTRWTSSIPISGMIDGAFEYKGETYLLEIKTSNLRGFDLLYEPHTSHKLQGCLYTLCTGVPKVMFLYYHKDTSELKAFVEEYSEEQIRWVRDRLQYIESCVLNNEVPKVSSFDTEHCVYCSFRKYCNDNFTDSK